jgi:hypothetical protein
VVEKCKQLLICNKITLILQKKNRQIEFHPNTQNNRVDKYQYLGQDEYLNQLCKAYFVQSNMLNQNGLQNAIVLLILLDVVLRA